MDYLTHVLSVVYDIFSMPFNLLGFQINFFQVFAFTVVAPVVWGIIMEFFNDG